jgi:VIT1/CCC1 family predicted Fe2+/Mn2+ transporter
MDLRLYLPQFVYGATDGIVTTFAIVAGAAGANLSPLAILAIGIASVLADGYSMGISAYLSSESETHTPPCPPPSKNTHKNSKTIGIATFLSFVLMGTIPIIPFMIPKRLISFTHAKILSLILALLSFFTVGYIKGSVHEDVHPVHSGLQTFTIGLSAAIVAYIAGYYVGA